VRRARDNPTSNDKRMVVISRHIQKREDGRPPEMSQIHVDFARISVDLLRREPDAMMRDSIANFNDFEPARCAVRSGLGLRAPAEAASRRMVQRSRRPRLVEEGAGSPEGAPARRPPRRARRRRGRRGATTRALARRARSIPDPRRHRPGGRAIGQAKIGEDSNRRG
jgi:hypothetical protein